MEIVNVKGYEGLYAVTDCGEVYSLKSGKRLQTDLSDNGYLRVTLYHDGTPKKHLLHRVVYFSFHRAEDDGRKDMVIDHINEDRRDNRLSNLRYITLRENIAGCSAFNANGLPRGVSRSLDGKYLAIITLDRRRFYMGTFDDEASASEAYENALKRFYECGETPYRNGSTVQIGRNSFLPHGVYVSQNGKKYIADAIIGRKRYRLGTFCTIDDAVAARDNALRDYASDGSLPKPHEIENVKYCCRCDQTKPRSEFYHYKKAGYSWLCKECSRQAARERDAARREAKLNNQNS